MAGKLLFIVLGALVASAPAQAQSQYWSDDFESYPTGQLASGAGGWEGWDNVPSAMGDSPGAAFSRRPRDSRRLVAGPRR